MLYQSSDSNFGAQEFLLHQVLLFPHQMVYNKATHVWPVQSHNILTAELADVVTIHQDVVNIMLLKQRRMKDIILKRLLFSDPTKNKHERI